MRILHLCLASFYIDDYGYQENILPKFHKLQGHTVKIVASTETYINNRELGYIEPKSYTNEHGIPVVRLPYAYLISHRVARKIRAYKGLYEEISNFRPDIIFAHGVQFAGVYDVVRYVKKHSKVKVFVDGHSDFINSARGLFSEHVLHRGLYRHFAQVIDPCVSKFFGVTPLRCDFFHDVYGIDSEKIELLVMGADDSELDYSKRGSIRHRVREKLGISAEAFVLVTGGKIDRLKRIDELIKLMSIGDFSSIKLIVFGQVAEDLEAVMAPLLKSDCVIDVGWASTAEVYDYYFAADLAVFPGTHSVLWEMAVGAGLPAILRRWKGMEHVDVGGNCLFVEDDMLELKMALKRVCFDEVFFQKMKMISESDGIEAFAYSKIAKRALKS